MEELAGKLEDIGEINEEFLQINSLHGSILFYFLKNLVKKTGNKL